MSYDLKYTVTCDHKIYSEALTPVYNESTGYYTAVLNYKSNGDSKMVRVWKKYTSTYITTFTISADGTTLTFTAGVDYSLSYYPVPIYLCDYATMIDYCPKCAGTGVVKDIITDVSGRFVVATGSDKLRQYVRKGVLTGVGNNPFHGEYGTILTQSVGSRINPQLVLKMYATVENLGDALKQYQSEQFNLDDSETLSDVTNVDLTQNTADPRNIYVEFSVTNKEYEELTNQVLVIT